MDAHTPGPWKVELPTGYPLSAKSNIIKPDGTVLASINYGIGEEEQANARLIAAAPDLLDALRAIASQAAMTLETFPNTPGRGDWANVKRIARAAITKATNTSP